MYELQQLRELSGISHIPPAASANMDTDLVNFAQLAGVSVDKYYLLKSKEKTFPGIDMRIENNVQPSFDLGKLNNLMRSTVTVEPVDSYDDGQPSNLDEVKHQMVLCFGETKPEIDDPILYDIVGQVYGCQADFKLVSEIYSQIYSPAIIESSAVVVPEIETQNGDPRFGFIIDESGDVSITDNDKFFENLSIKGCGAPILV